MYAFAIKHYCIAGSAVRSITARVPKARVHMLLTARAEMQYYYYYTLPSAPVTLL